MAKALTPQTKETVKATVPVLEAHGLEIVRAMYARMFENPEIRDLFNQSHHGGGEAQPRALTNAILAYAKNIDRLEALGSDVERIAQKHVGLQILPEHYPHVGNALLGAIKDVLGDAASDEVLEAWGEAYWFLADILIDREAHIYRELESTEGGWTGWRDFTVEAIRPESEIIRSFILRPADGKPVIRHKPGQYLTFWLDIPGQPPVKRNYSISCAPNGETYRISVKREPNGFASQWLHDTVTPGTTLKVAPPAGDFFLSNEPQRPVVLLSGGVGLTPMVAMLETIAEKHPSLPTHYVHGTLDGSTHAMGPHAKALAEQRPNIDATTFYQTPRKEDTLKRAFDHQGVIDQTWLAENTPLGEADYYLCGPRPFLRTLVSTLSRLGVGGERIHYEFFGPADEVLAA